MIMNTRRNVSIANTAGAYMLKTTGRSLGVSMSHTAASGSQRYKIAQRKTQPRKMQDSMQMLQRLCREHKEMEGKP